MTHCSDSNTARSSRAIVMSQQGKQNKKKVDRKHSQNKTRSAGKTRKLLTSRDVFYLVVKYEQEETVSKNIDQENLTRFHTERGFVMDAEHQEANKQNQSRRTSNQSVNSKGKDKNNSGHPDYFKDDKDCTLQSPMTSYSDHFVDDEKDDREVVRNTVEGPADNLTNDEESPGPSEITTNKKDKLSEIDIKEEENESGSSVKLNQDISHETAETGDEQSERKGSFEYSLSNGVEQHDDIINGNHEDDTKDLENNEQPTHVDENGEKDDGVFTEDKCNHKNDLQKENNGDNNDNNDNNDLVNQGDEIEKVRELSDDLAKSGGQNEDNDVSANEDSHFSQADHQYSMERDSGEEDDIGRGSRDFFRGSHRHSRQRQDEFHRSEDYSDSESPSYQRVFLTRRKPLKKGVPPRKPLTILSTRGDPLKNASREMKRVVQEIVIRGDKKIKDLTTQAQGLRRTSEILSEENKAMKKLHKLQSKEIREISNFVHMTKSSSKDVKRDVRNSEVTSVDMNTNVRKQVKEIIVLRRECERYEKLIEMDRKMPPRSVLQEKIEKAERRLESKDNELENLNKKVLTQQKKISQERQKENKKFSQLEEEIDSTMQECQELKKRLKEAEKRIDKTNIYTRRWNASIMKALPPAPSLPALPWHPPAHREKTKLKVKKWLADSNN